jgi:hypothetical protein
VGSRFSCVVETVMRVFRRHGSGPHFHRAVYSVRKRITDAFVWRVRDLPSINSMVIPASPSIRLLH